MLGGVKISIVVPAFNEEKLLGASLARVNAAAEVFTRRRWEWELIVCDNNSTDRTGEIARETGAPAGTVKARLARGRRALAPLVSEFDDSPQPGAAIAAAQE